MKISTLGSIFQETQPAQSKIINPGLQSISVLTQNTGDRFSFVLEYLQIKYCNIIVKYVRELSFYLKKFGPFNVRCLSCLPLEALYKGVFFLLKVHDYLGLSRGASVMS